MDRSYTKDEIIGIIENVLNEFKKRDGILLEKGIHEQAITHLIGCYLRKKFRGFNVDCEYNRNLDDQKSDPCFSCKDDKCEIKKEKGAKTKRPDIIIHKRGNENNVRRNFWTNHSNQNSKKYR